jgi:hypothetical protein
MGYFFAADVVVGILDADGVEGAAVEDGKEVELSVEEARKGRSWSECIAGFYYVSTSISSSHHSS